MTDATATPAAPPAPIAKPVSDDAGNLRKFLERHKDAIIAAAGNQISPERVLKVALLAATKSTKLSDPKLDRMSFLRAVVTAASLGLEPGSALGEGYLVPYWNSKRGVFEVEFQIGYRGFVALARRSGSIVSIDSRPVFKGEKFEPHYGTDPKIVHVPNFDIDRTP
jgi:recombination protein RecT